MPRDNPRGFVEHRHLGGAPNPATRRYRVKADGVSGRYPKRAGDPVILVSGHSVARVDATHTAASPYPLIGVIRAVYNSSGRPFTHNLPDNSLQINASTAGRVDVNVDPFMTYLVSTDATITSTYIGQFVETTVAAQGTAAGRSGFIIKTSGATNTALRTKPFQIIAIGANNLDDITGGETNQDVEVRIAAHAFNIWAPSSAGEPASRPA